MHKKYIVYNLKLVEIKKKGGEKQRESLEKTLLTSVAKRL